MKNEFPITIAGQEYTLKPTWEVVRNIENVLDQSVMALAMKINDGKMKITELVDIINVATKGQDNAPKPTRS